MKKFAFLLAAMMLVLSACGTEKSDGEKAAKANGGKHEPSSSRVKER